MKTFFEKLNKKIDGVKTSLLSDMCYQGADYPKNYIAFQRRVERHYLSYNSGVEATKTEIKSFIRQEMEELILDIQIIQQDYVGNQERWEACDKIIKLIEDKFEIID